MTRPPRTADAFTAVAEPIRRSMLGLTQDRPLTVTQIGAHFAVAQPTVSQHLAVLRRTGLVVAEQQGRERHYHLRPEGLAPIAQWLAGYHFWTERLDALGTVLAQGPESGAR